MIKQSISLRNQRGFTIVELLIVIVVIAILAAIVIVAYTGIQNKAHAAAAQSAASDLGKLLGIYNTTNGTYPTDLTTVNNGQPMSTSGGTSYAYHPGAGNTSYCVTVTNSNSSYKLTDTATTPVTGGCPGDGVGGVAAITNLNPNPSAETDGSLWGGFSNAGNTTLSVSTSGGFAGQNFMHLSVTTGTNGGGGIYAYNIPVTAGVVYTGSAYARMNSTKTVNLGLEWHSPSSGLGVSYGPNISIGPSGWTRLSSTGTAPAGATSVTLIMYTSGGSGLNAGDTLDIDAAMTTAGSTLYNYADGNSPSWIWNSTANNSSSTGPPL
jgi:prepilin-type N-terminal cleavage/methylation domain-containing protein